MSHKGFHFGLERVRELRVHDEDRAKEQLAASLAARGAADAALEDARRRMMAAKSTGGAGETLTAAQLIERQRWVERTEGFVSDATQSLQASEATVTQSRGAVVDAGRARESLDRLRDKRLAEFTLNARRAETAMLDEIALRNRRNGAPA